MFPPGERAYIVVLLSRDRIGIAFGPMPRAAHLRRAVPYRARCDEVLVFAVHLRPCIVLVFPRLAAMRHFIPLPVVWSCLSAQPSARRWTRLPYGRAAGHARLRQNRHIGNRADYAANRPARIVGKRMPVTA